MSTVSGIESPLVRPAPSLLTSSHHRPSLFDSLDAPAGFRTRTAATDKLATNTLRTEGLLLSVAENGG
jgi:hypothetical protein